ncbi:hypothetical protein ACWDVX_31055, partial [Streptomyces tendae]
MNRHDQHGSGRTTHRPWRTRLLAAAGAGALLLASGAVAPSVSAADGDGGDGGDKVLTVAVAQSVDSLSPFLAVRLLSTSIHRLTPSCSRASCERVRSCRASRL